MTHTLTIRTRLLAAYTLLFGVVLTGFSVLIYTVVKDERLTGLRTAMENHAEKLHSEIEEQVDRGTFPMLDDLHEIATEGLSGDHFRIERMDGTIVHDDSVLTVLSGSEPLVGHTSGSWQYPVTAGDVVYARLTVPLEIEGRTAFMLELAAPTTEIRKGLAQLRVLLLVAVPLTLLLAGLFAAWIVRAAFRPIAAIIDTATRIRGEKLGERIPVPPARDEIADLALTLNDMLQRIDATIESQRRFVADASHELRTPLTVLRSELEFALRTVTTPEARESMQTSLAEVGRLTRLAEGLLTLARLDSTQRTLVRKQFRLDELLLDCVQSLRMVAQARSISFAVQIGAPASFAGDQERIRSAVLNLLDNALKFSPDGGTVECLLELNSHEAHLTVGDEGPGIRSDELPKLFRRFYQSGESRSTGTGVGLGLAIVERIITLHGGAVRVESQPGAGARFHVTLPVDGGPDARR